MKRRLLTRNQTSLLQSLVDYLKTETGRNVLITDFLDACLYKPLIETLCEQIVIAGERKDKALTLASLQKELSVYQGEVISNNLVYKAIIAVRNKSELKEILGVEHVSNEAWTQTHKVSHVKIAITDPGKFFGCPQQIGRGRPTKAAFILLQNATAINHNNRL